LNLKGITANLDLMAHKNNNWLNYLLVFALMLLPLQNGMAAMNSLASAPAEVKQVCHEMMDHSQHYTAGKMDMQKHTKGCCDKNMNCQQQCADCLHCPAVSVIPSTFNNPDTQGLHYLYSVVSNFPDTAPPSAQLRPPRV
jgi:hypothetical protein